jgi:hypothetical protein
VGLDRVVLLTPVGACGSANGGKSKYWVVRAAAGAEDDLVTAISAQRWTTWPSGVARGGGVIQRVRCATPTHPLPPRSSCVRPTPRLHPSLMGRGRHCRREPRWLSGSRSRTGSWFRQQVQPNQGRPERNHSDLGYTKVVRDRRGLCSEVIGRLARQHADVQPHRRAGDHRDHVRMWTNRPPPML